VSASTFEIVRAVAAAATAKDSGGAMPSLEVRFSTFGNWYEINSLWEGNFLERTEQGAFVKTIAENRDNIKVLFNHGFDPQVGAKVLGTISDLREDPDSPVGDVALFDTSYNRDLLPGLQAGVYGSSMRMQVIKDEINQQPGTSAHNPRGIPERTIKEVRLAEFGPVTFPANPAATASVRSMTDEYYASLRSRDPERVADLERSRSPICTLRSDESQGAATNPTEPVVSTPRGLTPAQRRERFIQHRKAG
jgi:HK97 family phage prohead protease